MKIYAKIEDLVAEADKIMYRVVLKLKVRNDALNMLLSGHLLEACLNFAPCKFV